MLRLLSISGLLEGQSDGSPELGHVPGSKRISLSFLLKFTQELTFVAVVTRKSQKFSSPFYCRTRSCGISHRAGRSILPHLLAALAQCQHSFHRPFLVPRCLLSLLRAAAHGCAEASGGGCHCFPSPIRQILHRCSPVLSQRATLRIQWYTAASLRLTRDRIKVLDFLSEAIARKAILLDVFCCRP